MVKILLIDDEEINDLIFSHIIEGKKEIESYHYENNGWSALNYLTTCDEQNNFPDIIFVDLNMPEMHGFDFINFYENKFYLNFPDTKLIILTSSDLSRDKNKAFEYPSVDSFIKKDKGEEMVMHVIADYHK